MRYKFLIHLSDVKSEAIIVYIPHSRTKCSEEELCIKVKKMWEVKVANYCCTSLLLLTVISSFSEQSWGPESYNCQATCTPAAIKRVVYITVFKSSFSEQSWDPESYNCQATCTPAAIKRVVNITVFKSFDYWNVMIQIHFKFLNNSNFYSKYVIEYQNITKNNYGTIETN
jgi:hypothetical protein